MASSGTGIIEIPLEEFWNWVNKNYLPVTGEICYGVPRIDNNNQNIVINFAWGTELDPHNWPVRPIAVQEWEWQK